MSALGSLVVKLALDYAEYTQGLDKSDQAALKFAANAQRSFDAASLSSQKYIRGLVSNALQATGAYLTLNSMIGRLSSSIDVMAKIDDAAQKTGSSVENLSRIEQTMSAFGHDFAPMETALSKMSLGLATAGSETNKVKKALDFLKISTTDANGKIRDAADLTLEAAAKMREYEDGANKTRLAGDLWGEKLGANLLPALNDINDNIARFPGYSAEAAAEATDLQDKMNGLHAQVNMAFTSFALDLFPTLKIVAGALTDTADETSAYSGVTKVATQMIKDLVITGAAAGLVFGSLAKIVGTARDNLVAIIEGNFGAIKKNSQSLIDELKQDYADYQTFAEKILSANARIVDSDAKRDKPQGRLKRLTYESGDSDEAKKLASLNEASQKYLESLRLETLGVGASAVQIKLLAASKQAAVTPSKELALAIMTEAGAWARLAQFQEDAKTEFAALQAREDTFRDASNAILDYSRATETANESAQFELGLMGKTSLEREIAIEQRKAELELKRQILAITDQVTNAEDRAALIEQANAIGANAQAAARLQATARETASEWSRVWGSMEQTGKMAFVQLIGHGTSAFKSIGVALKASIIDMLYELTARKWIINIGASISGTLLSNAAGASSGGGNLLGSVASLLQGGQSIFSALSGGLTGGLSAAVSGLGSLFGSSAVGAFGAGLGLTSSAAAGAAGAYGAAGMGSIGAAISAGSFVGMLLPPVAIATALTAGFAMLNGDKKIFGVGGFLGAFLFGPLAAFFGKGPKRYGPALLTGDFTGEGFSGEFQQDWKRSVGWFSGAKKRGTVSLGISDEADALFDSVVTNTKKNI